MTSSAPVDLGDLEATRAWVDAAAAAYGGIDVLFNNASSPRVGPFVEMTAEDWHYTIRNELDLVYFATAAVWDPDGLFHGYLKGEG
jgi:NAD(P)-dependent dehydrogenase (short-subunit alcohol dehydrogenase family)